MYIRPPKVAWIAWEDCMMMEVVPLLSELTARGCVVRTVGVNDVRTIRTHAGFSIVVDDWLGGASGLDYQVLLLPGGDGYENLAVNSHMQRFIRQFSSRENHWLISQGTGTAVLAACKQLGGLRVSREPDLWSNHPSWFQFSIPSDEPCTVHGNVISVVQHADHAWIQKCLQYITPS